jgi:hypothetical protein
MANSVYPPASRELSQKWRALAPDIEAAFDAFSPESFRRGGAAREDQAGHRRRSRARHAMPVLRQGAHQGGVAPRCNARGAHGSNLGRRRDAGWGRLRSFGRFARGNGRSC